MFNKLCLILLLIPLSALPAETIDDANRLYSEGSQLRSQGKYLEALEKLGEAARIYTSLGAGRESMVSFYWVGECLVNLEKYELALNAYSLSLKLAEKVGGKKEKALILNMIGVSHSNLNNIEETLSNYEAALRLYTELDDRAGMALLNGNIGSACDNADCFEEALIHYLKAISLYEELSNDEQVAFYLHDAGLMYELLGRYQEASACFERAASINARLGLKEREALMLYKLGIMQKNLGKFDEARNALQGALEIHEELKSQDGIPAALTQLGEIEETLGNYRKALAIYERVHEMDRRNGRPLDLASTLNHLGGVYKAWGRYDEALKFYEKALEISREQKDYKGTSANLSNVGDLYRSWGKYGESLKLYEEALAINRKQNRREGIGNVSANMGNLFSLMRRSVEAHQYMEDALSIFEALGNREKVATILNNLGQLFNSDGDYDQAVGYFERALELNEALGMKETVATVLNNLGSVYSLGKRDDQRAIEYFGRALSVFEELESRENMAGVLNNIGVSYGNMKRYEEAIGFLNRTVDLKEALRLTAKGAIRRDYLASQLYTYQILISILVKAGRPAEAFDTIELASSKYLIEQMGEKWGPEKVGFSGVRAFQRQLPADQAIINYANVDSEQMVQIVAGNDRISAVEVNRNSFLEKVRDTHGQSIRRAVGDLRGISLKSKEVRSDSGEFNNAITYYRYLLSQPSPNGMERAAMEFIGRALYELLILPLEPNLRGKRELLILPDGILAFLPFEALIAPDGLYLVQHYNIHYSQSLAVTELIRKRVYSGQRKPMLVFGGAVYDQLHYKEEMITNERQLEYLVTETLEALEGGGSTRGAYSTLGLGEWSNLPGTLAEVRAIASILPDIQLLTGVEASEGRIKDLSENGALRDFKVLHFATHGLVVPEIPELSAVVLSLLEDEPGGEDGYLTMREIAALDINADFVNLSACETGLGKIYGGEGVVGLTQSFLIAGANGLSVSLWQVSDESTMRFMTGLYKMVEEHDWDYHRTLNEMKRVFIQDDKLALPFYWAPFVYYGQ